MKLKRSKLVFLIGMIIHLLGMPSSAWSEMLKVEQVYEVDLVKLNDGRVVKLIGIAAPTLDNSPRNQSFAKQRGLTAENLQSYAFIAIRYVKNILEGKSIYVTFDNAFADKDHRDDQGNLIGYLWFPVLYKDNRETEGDRTFLGITAQDRLLNGELIKLGYAFADTRANFTYRNAFIEYEKKAKVDKKGLWLDRPPSYQDFLMRGEGALIASRADYVTDAVRSMAFAFAKRTFTELIDQNPTDYRGYYSRSWLGADPYNRKVDENNLSDITKAIALAPRNPMVYLQKHFIYRLLAKDVEASEAFQIAVQMSPDVSEGLLVTDAMKRSFENQAKVLKLQELPQSGALMEDAFRAGLNEEHFILFMARMKRMDRNDPVVQKFFSGLMEQLKFKQFHEKYEKKFEKLTWQEILYQTTYSKNCLTNPENQLELLVRRT